MQSITYERPLFQSSAIEASRIRSIVDNELKFLKCQPLEFVSAAPASVDNSFEWDVVIIGPPNTPYENGLFNLQLTLPYNYPLSSPTVKFITNIYHPNVDLEGRVYMAGLSESNWDSQSSIWAILLDLDMLMSAPELDHAARPELALEFNEDQEKFELNAKAFTWNHAIESDREKDQAPTSSDSWGLDELCFG